MPYGWKYPKVSGAVCGTCIAVTLVGVILFFQQCSVVKAKRCELFHATDGRLMVRWFLEDGSRYETSHPMQEHAEAIELEGSESVWYHPRNPSEVVYYGKVWPVPYVAIMLVALALPTLLSFLYAVAAH